MILPRAGLYTGISSPTGRGLSGMSALLPKADRSHWRGILKRDSHEISAAPLSAIVGCRGRFTGRLTHRGGGNLSKSAGAVDHWLSAWRLGRHHRTFSG